jgi:pyruvate dehydrogenase E1 component alpha subunit
MARDPIDIFRNILIRWSVLDQAKAEQIEADAKKEVNEAFEWAAQQPLAKPEDGLKNVFVEGSVEPRQLA